MRPPPPPPVPPAHQSLACPLKPYHQTSMCSLPFGTSPRLLQLTPQACASNTSLMWLKFQFLLPDVDSLATTPCRQHTLLATLESTQFNSLLTESSTADKAHLLSVSLPHASAWFSAVPSPGLCLSLDPNEHQMAIKWWLGLDTSLGSPPCALCPEHPLDPLGHHALTCKQGGDAVSRHNKFRDVVLQTCHRACIRSWQWTWT